MYLNNICIVFLSALVLISVHGASSLPRVANIPESDDVVNVDETELNVTPKVEVNEPEANIIAVKIHGRVSCRHEDPIEDDICQEHCLPKGYSYGICVSKVCSCI